MQDSRRALLLDGRTVGAVCECTWVLLKLLLYIQYIKYIQADAFLIVCPEFAGTHVSRRRETRHVVVGRSPTGKLGCLAQALIIITVAEGF